MFELGIGEAELVKAFMEKDFEDIKIEKDLKVLNIDLERNEQYGKKKCMEDI